MFEKRSNQQTLCLRQKDELLIFPKLIFQNMITIFEDKFISIYFEDAQKLFISKWSVDSADITMGEIKSEVLNGVELILKYKPQFYLSDNRNQEFIFETIRKRNH